MSTVEHVGAYVTACNGVPFLPKAAQSDVLPGVILDKGCICQHLS